jgi:hypothetical protein
MMPDAFIAHESPGRLRIRIPSYRADAGALAASRDNLSQCPGMISVEINPATASMLFLHQTSTAAIFEYAREKNVFTRRVPSPATYVKSRALQKNMADAFKGFDRQIRSLTDGDMDLSGFAFAALAMSGIYQILVGNAGALPWHAAFWYAFNILPKASEGSAKEDVD